MAETIRAAQASDVDAVRDCVRAAYSMYLERMDQEPAPMTADYASLVERGVVFVLAEEDGSGVIGVLVAFGRGDHYFIENVAVDSSVAGTGRGRRLLDFAEDEARREGFDRIELYTNAVMYENIEYYPRLGYVETGRREEDGFPRVYFEKRLAAADGAP